MWEKLPEGGDKVKHVNVGAMFFVPKRRRRRRICLLRDGRAAAEPNTNLQIKSLLFLNVSFSGA